MSAHDECQIFQALHIRANSSDLNTIGGGLYRPWKAINPTTKPGKTNNLQSYSFSR